MIRFIGYFHYWGDRIYLVLCRCCSLAKTACQCCCILGLYSIVAWYHNATMVARQMCHIA